MEGICSSSPGEILKNQDLESGPADSGPGGFLLYLLQLCHPRYRASRGNGVTRTSTQLASSSQTWDSTGCSLFSHSHPMGCLQGMCSQGVRWQRLPDDAEAAPLQRSCSALI